MKKKVLMSVCAGVLALGLLTGCQASGDTKENDTQTQETDAEKAAEDGDDDAQNSSDGEQVVLTVFDAHAYGLEEYDEMVKKFEEEHPGVKIAVQHSPNDYDTLLLARLNAGTYGELKSLRLRRSGEYPSPWFLNSAKSGGVILDLHIHDVDFIKYLLGRPGSIKVY